MSTLTAVNTRLLAIATNPVNSVADVIAAFEAISEALPDSDGLKWFNWLYLTVTRAVDLRIETGHWQNAAWLTQLDIVFARLYLKALRSSLTPGGSPPKCWKVLFDARNDARLARIQFALCGINAHIDRDLSVALVETCTQFGNAPLHLSPEYQDYCQVNQLLDTIVGQAKKELLTGLLGAPLPCLNRVEDLTAAVGLRASREAAWTHGEILGHISAVPGLGSRFIEGLDNAAALVAKGLLAPVGI